MILDNISFDVPQGDIVSIIGRNGVGKTTVMRTVMGQTNTYEGDVLFDGESITSCPPHERARAGIGYVPQGRDVFPRMTVKENLRMGSQINNGSSTFDLKQIYEFFPRLEERSSQEAGTLSGGEQQMLAIGRALISHPKLLLLDEPSEGIQPSIVKEISTIVRKVKAEIHTTILFAEQNLEFTIHTSDICLVMSEGKIVDNVPPDELRDSEAIQKYLSV
jgi:branched-chain amino acid transport system ATP-binding protein